MKTVLVKCWRGGQARMNLGEWFCEWLLAGLGYGIEYMGKEPSKREPLILVGSGVYENYLQWILRRAPACHVWGAGNGEALRAPADSPRVHYHALRGPLTKALCGVHENIPLLDAGFMLSTLHPLTRTPSKEILYVPHHAERTLADVTCQKVGASDWVDVILSREAAGPALQRIVNAEFVLTGTLHTMIACLAYGTPCACCVPFRGNRNMPLKWLDAFAAVGMEMPPPVRSLTEGREWYEQTQMQMPSTDKMLAAFPRWLAE